MAEKNFKGIRHLRETGGEEFLILLPDTDGSQGINAAERIRTSINKNVYCKSPDSIPITISAGVTILLAMDQSIDSVIKRADDALYKAKNNGRNRVEFLP